MSEPAENIAQLKIEKGAAYVYYAFDVGRAIQLDGADRHITDVKERTKFKSKRRMGKYFDFDPVPIRVTQTFPRLEVTPDFRTTDTVESMLFDFGAISVGFKIPLDTASLEKVIALSDVLYENESLLSAARQVVEALLRDIAPAVDKSGIAEWHEDYIVFELRNLNPAMSSDQFVKYFPNAIASLIRAETAKLARDEVASVMHHRISYGENDVTVIDWNSALIYSVEDDMEDVRTILEFANVELLEFAYLDRQLDHALDEFYDLFASKDRRKRGRGFLMSPGPELKRVGQFQIDSAVLYESVTNSLKLLGDEFLARVYRLASQRFSIPEWDNSISRKLRTIESIYSKISDGESGRRMEILEWIIIFLIAVSIILPFVPGWFGR